MKRRSKLLIYIFTISFFSVISLFFLNNQVGAWSYVCVDSLTEGACVPGVTDYEEAYYTVVNVNENEISQKEVNGKIVKYLEIPESMDFPYDESITYTLPVKVIGDGINPLIEYNENYILDEVILPSKTAIIKTNSLAGFASIKNITIPQSVELIENYIFKSDATVENVYFNAYKFTNNMDDYIQINNLAFPEGVVNNIICENLSVYNYYYQYFSYLKYNYLLTKVTYNYFEYEGASDPLDSKVYYVGENVLVKDEDLCEFKHTVNGLTFIGWRVKDRFGNHGINGGSKFYFNSDYDSYNVYPDFSLNPLENIKVVYSDGVNLNQEIASSVLDFTYDGITRSLSVEYDPHPVASQKVTWYKNNASISPNIYNVYDSGTYQYKIISSYLYQGQTYTREQEGTVDAIVNKRSIVVNAQNITQIYGEGLKADSCGYSVENLLAIHTILEVRCLYYEDELDENEKVIVNVGEYSKSIKVELTSIKQEGSGNEKDNYVITYNVGNYKVNQKQIPVYYTQVLEVVYGETVEVRDIYQDSDTNESISIKYGKEAGLVVGEYNIVSAQSENPNYYAILDKDKTTGKVKIIPRGIDLQFSLSGTVYDGDVKAFEVYYIDVVTNVVKNVDYTLYKYDIEEETYHLIDEIRNAGSYQAEVKGIEDTNYYINGHEDLTLNPYYYSGINIAKATPAIIKADSQTVEYSGSKIEPHAIVNNTEQTPKYKCLKGNEEDVYGCIKSGVYYVNVYVEPSENYIAYDGGQIRLTISSRKIYLSPKEYTFYYNEDIKIRERMEIENTNGSIETVELVYTSAAKKGNIPGKYALLNAAFYEPGTTNQVLNFSPSFSKTATEKNVTIIKRPVEVVYFDYTDLVYNGEVRQIGTRVVDKFTGEVIRDVELNLVCDEGEIKDAKKYHLRTYIDDVRYYIDNVNLLEFRISKARYDLSNIKFEDKRVHLDFKKHALSIVGKLPDGVKVVYTIDGKDGNATSKAFEHTVVATFIGDTLNYLPLNSIEATMYIDASWVFVSFAMAILLSALIACVVLLHIKYRRLHPKKIKLKIRTIVKEDLEAKRIATSVKEVLGDDGEEEQELLEDDNDLMDETAIANNFIDRIYAASSELKYYYSEVKNELLSYSGVMHTVDRKYEVFYHGPRQIAKLSICNNVLKLYVNLAPEKYDKEQYKHRDMSKFDCHARTPLRIDVNTTESLRHAKVFIRILRKKENLKASSDFVRIDYEKFYTLKENIIPKIFKKMFNPRKGRVKK